jgi:hypothetical protein
VATKVEGLAHGLDFHSMGGDWALKGCSEWLE